MLTIKRCRGCLMANSKPGVTLNEIGLCQACMNRLKRKDVNWRARQSEFELLLDNHRRENSEWDCIVPSSGGKDSWYQVKVLKDFGMNPLCVRVTDPFTHTSVGKANWKNMLETYHVDGYTFELSPGTARNLCEKSFYDFGSPTWPIDRAIYSIPIVFGYNMGIPLIVYGENVSYEYGGVKLEESCSAKEQINNDVAKSLDLSDMVIPGEEELCNMNGLMQPSKGEMACVEPVYLSYFFPWSGFRNYSLVRKDGFQSLRDYGHRWKRNGYIEPYDQIDSVGYLVNVWMKYIKLGFGRATDMVGYWIRDGLLTKDMGRDLINRFDHKLDSWVMYDFCELLEMSKVEFRQIASMHRRKYEDDLNTIDIDDRYYEELFDHENKLPTVDEWEDFDELMRELY